MYIRNKNKFRVTRFILLKISWLFKLLTKFRRPNQRILIVRTNAIGDYILFRNFLEGMKESTKYKDYEIDLLGNTGWKDLALEYDNSYISEFYFINEQNLYEKPGATFMLGWKLFKRKYKIVLHPTYSRTLMANGLAALAAGKEAIAYNSNHELHPRYKKQTDRLYTSLLELPPNIYHEYDRISYFFQQITGQTDFLLQPSLPVAKKPGEGIVIFAGSSDHKRNWQKEKFLEIIKLLLEFTNEKIIIAGGPSEVPISSYLLGALPSSQRIVDTTGGTRLPELIELISTAKLVITNETSTVHIAVASEVPTICLVGGGHFDRFVPYTDNMNNKPICVYERMACYNCNWQCVYDNGTGEPYPCISRINVEKVWAEISALIFPIVKTNSSL